MDGRSVGEVKPAICNGKLLTVWYPVYKDTGEPMPGCDIVEYLDGCDPLVPEVKWQEFVLIPKEEIE